MRVQIGLSKPELSTLLGTGSFYFAPTEAPTEAPGRKLGAEALGKQQ
jgi:hypothetical protein